MTLFRDLGPFHTTAIGHGEMPLTIENNRGHDVGIETLHASLDAGCRHIDTAWSYYCSGGEEQAGEELVREAMDSWKGPKDEVLIATKVGHYRNFTDGVPTCGKDGNPEHLIRYGCFINASAVAFRRHAHLLEAVDEGCQIILDHPWHILNALYGKGTVDAVTGVYGRYRIHADSFGGQTKRSPERREQVLADQLRACDNARAFGIDEAIIAAGKAHYRFATALYFLKQGDMARFTRFINESVVDHRFFDARHQLAWEGRHDPAQVARQLFGCAA